MSRRRNSREDHRLRYDGGKVAQGGLWLHSSFVFRRTDQWPVLRLVCGVLRVEGFSQNNFPELRRNYHSPDTLIG